MNTQAHTAATPISAIVFSSDGTQVAVIRRKPLPSRPALVGGFVSRTDMLLDLIKRANAGDEQAKDELATWHTRPDCYY